MNPCVRFGDGFSATLYSCGFRGLWMRKPWQYKSNKELVERTEDSIKYKLKQQGHQAQLNLRLNVTQYCLDIGNPDENADLRGHWGENGVTMQLILMDTRSQPKLVKHLARVKRFAREFTEGKSEGHFHAAMMCSKGRHRSVALAAMCKWGLKDSGFDVRDTVHVCSDGWDHLCTTCTQCGTCTWMKEDLKRDVLEIWRSL